MESWMLSGWHWQLQRSDESDSFSWWLSVPSLPPQAVLHTEEEGSGHVGHRQSMWLPNRVDPGRPDLEGHTAKEPWMWGNHTRPQIASLAWSSWLSLAEPEQSMRCYQADTPNFLFRPSDSFRPGFITKIDEYQGTRRFNWAGQVLGSLSHQVRWIDEQIVEHKHQFVSSRDIWTWVLKQ